MRIGVPTEIKTGEHRVGMTPSGVGALVNRGHTVVVEAGSGIGSGFSDDQYGSAGAEIATNAKAVWESVDMVVKVKEPVGPELDLLVSCGQNLTLFTYLHLAGVPGIAEALVDAGTTAIAYETVQDEHGRFPLLAPMSEVAGKLAIHAASEYLRRPAGSKGQLISGGPGIPPSKVAIIGAGVVGQAAARIAMAIGAEVALLNRSSGKLREFESHAYPGNLVTEIATPESISRRITECDAVVGAVYVSGARASHVITREMLSTMQPGTVLVDVSIDQGGCFETSRPTTFDDPVFVVDDVIHYCVANMPGSVPRTSTLALTNETLPYVMSIATQGLKQAVENDPALAGGVNVYRGAVTDDAVAEATGLEHRSLNDLLAG